MIGGKLQTAEELHRAYNDLKNIDETFTTMVNKISVEMIGKKKNKFHKGKRG